MTLGSEYFSVTEGYCVSFKEELRLFRRRRRYFEHHRPEKVPARSGAGAARKAGAPAGGTEKARPRAGAARGKAQAGQLEQQKKELEELKERCVQQGKDIILEAKNRAESIIRTANDNASQIVSDAEANRDSVYIKAKAEGFEQGTRDGREACLAAGRDILDEAKSYADRINSEKEQLFADYEKEIYDTVMQIAKKVTLDSITSKDSAAVKRLIKKAAKEFRNCERVKITLNDNGANEELTGDYEYLKELCGGIPNVEVELLPEADPGTVIVDNGSEIVDAGIMTQLRMIQELGDGKFREPKPTRKKKKPAPEPAEEADAEE